ncbi:hypothetical protein SDC9_206255 [bioreactor metagenome]|uniref:Uncharacterized protein n=1 Tax=bioreactor metagenome TaxID=1076179 RepID=A0A645J778_9ZZZZ
MRAEIEDRGNNKHKTLHSKQQQRSKQMAGQVVGMAYRGGCDAHHNLLHPVLDNRP